MIFNILVTAFLCLLSTINAYSKGAPATVCLSMLPQHGNATAQSNDPPYILTIHPLSYSNGTIITGKSIMQIEIL